MPPTRKSSLPFWPSMRYKERSTASRRRRSSWYRRGSSMWWREGRIAAGRLGRLAAAIAMAAMTAACFQPLYGDRSLVGGAPVAEALAGVEVAQIDAPKGSPLSRIAVETRNQLIFDLTGGAGRAAPTHRLTIRLITAGQAVILDLRTLRLQDQQFGLD